MLRAEIETLKYLLEALSLTLAVSRTPKYLLEALPCARHPESCSLLTDTPPPRDE